MKRNARDTSSSTGMTPQEQAKLASREKEFNGVRGRKIYE